MIEGWMDNGRWIDSEWMYSMYVLIVELVNGQWTIGRMDGWK